MFKIGDNCITISGGRWYSTVFNRFIVPGPNKGEIIKIIDILSNGNLRFKEYPLDEGYTSWNFRKLVSDSDLNYYRDTVSKVELQELVEIEKVLTIQEELS